MVHRATKDNKEIQELKDPRDHLEDQGLPEAQGDQELKGNEAILDFQVLPVVMGSLVELDCQVLLGQLVSLDRMEQKETWAHLVKRVSRAQKDR